jgi:hypothetical protein
MKYAWTAAVFASAAIVGMSACGGTEAGREGSSGPDAKATTAEVEQACAGSCGSKAQCDGEPEAPSCVQECMVDKLGSAARNMRSDAARALGSCLASLPCESDDDDCTVAAIEATGADPDKLGELPEVRACRERFAECPSMDGSFSFCEVQVLLATPAKNASAACLDAPCEDIYDCMSRAFYGP